MCVFMCVSLSRHPILCYVFTTVAFGKIFCLKMNRYQQFFETVMAIIAELYSASTAYSITGQVPNIH